MRLFGLLCVRNEADRYLSDCLQWHAPILDDIFVYDDQSTDDSAALAESYGAKVEIRPDDVPSFTENEGQFRQAAWDAFELNMFPEREDWVLAFDADEFFVSGRDERDMLLALAYTAQFDDTNAVTMHFNEVFGETDDHQPLIRTDGFWGETDHPRFFRYQWRGRYANRRMGGGSVPSYVQPSVTCTASFLHYGYAKPEDRIKKHDFYTSIPCNGHNPQHIASIVAPESVMKLEQWKGKTPWKP